MADTISPLTLTFRGYAGSPGRACGPAFGWDETPTTVTAVTGDPLAAIHAAYEVVRGRLQLALATADATLAPLLDAQRLMLDDPEFREGILAQVQSGIAPSDAVVAVSGQMAALLEAAGSEYFRERAIDVRALGKLMQEALSGAAEREIPHGAVVIARELGPLDTARLAHAGVAALVTVNGGPTCHAAIIARAWGVPAVVGAPEEVLTIADGTPLLVDGVAGTMTTHPSDDLLTMQPDAPPAVHIARRVPVLANIGSLAEAERAVELGAEGVGLLRTEFLFQDRQTPPTEEEQYEQYAAILRCLGGRTVTVRTLDIGADKPVPFLPMPSEPNPQLGLRGIRLCLKHHDLFIPQLRALVRAAVIGPLKIMLPMVATVDEVREARRMLEEIAGELHLPVPPLGAMIEIPMAALAAPELVEVCDFFSLGTNDLMQFVLAADRQYAAVGYLHAYEHRAIWRLIEPVLTVAKAAQVPVSVCGEWGADPEKLAQLVDSGIDAVSVAVAAIPRVRGMFGERA